MSNELMNWKTQRLYLIHEWQLEVIAMQEAPRLDSLPAFLVPACHKKSLHIPDEDPIPKLS